MNVFYSIFKKKEADVDDDKSLYVTYDKPPDEDVEHKDIGVDEDEEKKFGSIEEAYSDAELIGNYIVRDEEMRRFYVISDLRQLYAILTGPNLRCMHEVVLAGHRQKLRFDFDFNKAAFDEIVESSTDGSLMSDLLQAPERVLGSPLLGDAIKADYRAMLTGTALCLGGYGQLTVKNQQMIVGDLMIRDFIRFLSGAVCAYILRCDSYTVESDKFSVHLIVGAYTRNYTDMSEFAHHLYTTYRAQSEFARLTARFLDMAVYKSLQNFRLCLAVKKGAGHERRKVLRNSIVGDPSDPDYEFANWRHTLLTYISRYDVDITAIARAKTGISRPTADKDLVGMVERGMNALPDGFMKIIESYSKGLQPCRYVGNMVLFRRIMASHCAICRRTHEYENSLIVVILRNAYVIKCRRDAAGKKIIIPISSKIVTRAIHAEQAARESVVGAPITSPGPSQAPQCRPRVDRALSELMF